MFLNICFLPSFHVAQSRSVLPSFVPPRNFQKTSSSDVRFGFKVCKKSQMTQHLYSKSLWRSTLRWNLAKSKPRPSLFLARSAPCWTTCSRPRLFDIQRKPFHFLPAAAGPFAWEADIPWMPRLLYFIFFSLHGFTLRRMSAIFHSSKREEQ